MQQPVPAAGDPCPCKGSMATWQIRAMPNHCAGCFKVPAHPRRVAWVPAPPCGCGSGTCAAPCCAYAAAASLESQQQCWFTVAKRHCLCPGRSQVTPCGCGAFAAPCRVCAAAAQLAAAGGPAIGSRLVGSSTADSSWISHLMGNLQVASQSPSHLASGWSACCAG